MRILVGNNHLQKVGGTENYTYTLAVELKRLGHEVEYFTFERGEISNKLEQQGIPFMSYQHYDLILANHIPVIEYLYSYGYIVQTCHGVLTPLEQPSIYADKHVAISGELKEYIRGKGFEAVLIQNGIDCERFAPINPISPQLKVVLSLSQSDELNGFIKDCCDEIGVRFIACNKFTDNVWEVEKKINEADLVVGIGRSLYDAMACGRCVISYDNRTLINGALGDGYINKDNIEKSIFHNFIGRGYRKTFNREGFINELKKYNPADGEWARNYALANLNIVEAVKEYISLHESFNSENWRKELLLKNELRKTTDNLQKHIQELQHNQCKYAELQNEYVGIQKQLNELHVNFQRVNSKRMKYLKTIRLIGLGTLVGFLAVILALLINITTVHFF